MSTASDVVMYSTGWCPYCVRAKALLERKGVPFREIRVDEDPAERQAMLPQAKELLEFSKFVMKFAKENVFPKYLETIQKLGVIEVGYLGTVGPDGALDFYDGKLRLMQPDGAFEDFAYDQYTDYLTEHVEDWSYQKFPYAKKWGGFALDLANPQGVYRTNTLARINVADKMKTPLAQAELEEFRNAFGRPAHQTLLYHYARLIELLQAAEEAVMLLEDKEITGTDIRVPIAPREARGVGCVEAPRGTLIHDYTMDKDGLITAVNLIVGTTHNNAAINLSVNQAAKEVIKGGVYDQGILNKVEMAIRAFSNPWKPCRSPFGCRSPRSRGGRAMGCGYGWSAAPSARRRPAASPARICSMMNPRWPSMWRGVATPFASR